MCRSLGLDLSGQTSASYNMRLNYERCLLDFENYLGCGQYTEDLASGNAPHYSVITEPLRNLGHLPPPDTGMDDFEGNAWPGQQAQGTVPAQNLRPRAARAPATADSGGSGGGGAQPAAEKLSFLELLSLDDEDAAAATAAAAAVQATGVRVAGMGHAASGLRLQRHWPESGWWDCTVAAYNAETGVHCPKLFHYCMIRVPLTSNQQGLWLRVYPKP